MKSNNGQPVVQTAKKGYTAEQNTQEQSSGSPFPSELRTFPQLKSDLIVLLIYKPNKSVSNRTLKDSW